MSDRRGNRGLFGFGRGGTAGPGGREGTAGPGGRGAKTVATGSGAPGTFEAQGASSPVTDGAREAALGLALPDLIPPGAAPELTIDALGRKCPIPIIMLAGRIREVPVGSVIAVLADDPAAYSDVPAWCALKSHDCVFRVEAGTGWSFGIRRGY